jgi:hypothetical protein
MAHSAELFEHGSSSHHSTDSNADPAHEPDCSTTTLAEIIAAVVASALTSTKQMDSSFPSTTEATSQLADL